MAFHAGNRGSTPRGDANNKNMDLEDIFWSLFIDCSSFPTSESNKPRIAPSGDNCDAHLSPDRKRAAASGIDDMLQEAQD